MTEGQRYTDSFNLHADRSRKQAAAQELDDLNHAIAGVDVGRQRKHIHDDRMESGTNGKGNAAERLRRTLEWLLLNDQNYAHLYNTAISTLRDTLQAAGDTLEQVLTKLEDVREQIAHAKDNAATLPNGTRVFRDEDGVVRDENGQAVADDLAATIVWRGDEPSYEAYHALIEQETKLQAAENELRGIETELGGYQDELTDNEEPLSPDRLEDITDRSNALRDRVQEIESTLAASPVPRNELVGASSEMEVAQRTTSVIPEIKFGG